MVGFPYLCQIIEECVIGNSVNQFAECWNCSTKWSTDLRRSQRGTKTSDCWSWKTLGTPNNPLGNHHAHHQKNPRYRRPGGQKPDMFQRRCTRTCWMKIHGYVIEQYQLTWLKSGQSPGVLVELPEIYLCHDDPWCINRTSRICREGNSKLMIINIYWKYWNVSMFINPHERFGMVIQAENLLHLGPLGA